jgi:gliding motility-associated-like protein
LYTEQAPSCYLSKAHLMKQTFTLSSIILLTLLFQTQHAFAQCSTQTCQLPQYSDNAPGACILPSPSALDCYYGATVPSVPQSFPPFWCTTIENNQWFAFTADATSASFNISVFGCAAGSGIQAAVLSTADCIDFTFVSACLGNIGSNSTQNLVASPLVIGENYYLMIDGNAGAQCDFAINASLPTVTGTTNGLCIPSSAIGTYQTAGVSTWTINPSTAGNIIGNAVGTSITVQWLEPGPAEVCATSTQCPGAPEFCLPVFIGEDITTTEMVDLCQGKTVMCGGSTFSQAGTFMVNLPTYLNCDSIINCVVTLIPTVYTDVDVNICQNGTATCAGEEFFAPGNYNVPFTNYQGCDSIVRCRVKLVPTYNSPIKFVNLCGPAQYQVCNATYTTSGLYQEVCTGYLGCDSIINTNLAILEPNAVIAPPGILDCDQNINITLNGSGSNINTAVGGITLYNWYGPPGGIIGFSNQPTALIGQPGQYCLVLTHGRGGVFCRDTACVTVTAISAVPQLPQISGNPNPCGDSTYVYTATAGGLPLPSSYTWTIPGNLSYTQLTQNSIQITWDTVVMGNLCVTANNSCGSSQPACSPITVIPPIQPPQMSGPTNVCANGGTYLFTLNLQQNGTNYNWTVPPGAVLTGSGDSVMVNFLNAVSGQVCVVPSNVCGTGAPVCRPVQVNPIPTADLSSNAQICDGESVNLTFGLTGNGLFDVTWSVGNVTSTLNDIANGHVVAVNPTQTTKYKILSIADNSNPTCSAVVADSVTVTVRPNFSATATAQICEGESILLGGALQTVSGIYTDSLQSVYGCDSVIITTLTVFPIDTTILTSASCDPNLVGTTTNIYAQTNGCDSVVIHTVTLLPSDSVFINKKSCDMNNVGVFTQNLSNIYGCDSTVVTTVVFSLSDTTLLSAGSCDPNMTGVFVQNLLTFEGCDSIIITTVSLLPSNTTNLTGTTCNPSQVGVFPVVLSNQFGCDSTIITTINFVPLDTTYLTGANCDPAMTGVFTNTLTTAGGCDSVLVTTVSLLPSNTTNLTGTSCNPAQVGVFPVVLSNQFGCDSTVITTISFVPLPTTFLTGANCDPAMTGVFTNTVTTAGGCDSILVTTVSLLPSNTTNLTGTSCNPAQVGVFPVVLSNQFGCDSTVITTISFVPLPTTFLTGANCDPAMTGVFTNTVTTAGGCDSILVTTVSLLPSSATSLSDQSCNPSEVGVFTSVLSNQFGCDSTVTLTVTFAPIDSVFLTATTCNPASAGVFAQDYVTPAGCDSVAVTTVSLLPSNQTAVQTTTCDPAMAGVFVYPLVNIFGCDSIVTETRALLPSSMTNIALTTCNPTQVGSVTNVVPNQWGCDSTIVTTTSLLPANSCGVSATLQGSNIPCVNNTGTLNLTMTVGQAPFNYTVLLGGTPVANGVVNALNTPNVISGLAPGNYTLNITSPNGYSTTAQATIVQLVPPSLSSVANSDFAGFDVSCNGASDGTALATATGGLPPYTFAWSVGGNTAQINNLSAGIYTVTVNDANNCTTVSTVALTEPTEMTLGFTVNDLDCFGQNDGAIQVQASGGAPPYSYSLNNGPEQASNLFSGLSAGAYTLVTSDANDCTQTEALVVNAAFYPSVELGDNISIELGDETVIQAVVNVPLDSILSVVWTPPFDTSECPSCLTQVVTPFVSTTYSIEITTLNGCTDEDKVTVLVDRRRQVYIPNVFSPNLDGSNDIFTVYAKPGTVRTIRSLQIFDRWGDALFILEDFPPNSPTQGWDGTYRGSPMNPAVFVWMVEIEFMDGQVELYKGDVTIVR